MNEILFLAALLTGSHLPGMVGAAGRLGTTVASRLDTAAAEPGEPGASGTATAARWWRMDLDRPGGFLLSARFRARIEVDADTTTVRLTYVLQPGRGVTELPVSIARLEDAEVRGIRASWNGRAAGVVFVAGGGAALHGAIALPGARPDVPGTLDLTYTVPTPGAADRPVRVPVVAALWPIARPQPGTFTAEIVTARGMAAYEGFPTRLRTASGGGNDRRYRLAAPEVPPLVGFRLAQDLAPWFTMAALLAAALLGAILGFVLPGWRQKRRRAL